MNERAASDDGTCPPLLARALPTGLPLAVAAALRQERLLIPIVRAPAGALVADDADPCGTGEAMASVTFLGNDGRRALLAFSSVATLHAWDPAARPLPQPGPQLAAAVVRGGLDALLVDVASEGRLAIPAAVLEEYALAP